MSWVSLQNITKNLDGRVILDKVQLDIEKGEMFALLGPSGCGKTTILKIIAGLLSADTGDISIAGRQITHLSPKQRKAVLVFQDYLLFPHMTVANNIGFGLRAQKLNASLIAEKVTALLTMIQLEREAHKYPHQLSGGQQQRVAIARALAVSPDILLLDEPFSNLDTRLRDSMQDFVASIHRATGTTTILVTHNKDEAFKMCDRIAVMQEGKILQVGTAQALYENPSSLAVAQYFGEIDTICGLVKAGRAVTIFGEQASRLAEASYSWTIRPEHIHFTEQNMQNSAIITHAVYMGEYCKYIVEIAGESFRVLCSSSCGYKEGDRVGLAVDLAKAVHIEVHI